MRKSYTMVGIVALGMLSLPAILLGEEEKTMGQKNVTGQKAVAFPQSDKCSTNSPCSNVMGEILRIEESYWIKTPDGGETHLKVSKDTKMEGLPKIGDTIAAQLNSRGDADSIVKLDEIPKPKEMQVPSQSHQEFR